ncbi:MAG: N-acetyltransferase family protein [Bacteroidota bacterium]
MKSLIRPMQAEDWNAIARIYREGIVTGIATFESEVPSYKDWDTAHLEMCRFVAELKGNTVGWAALSPVSSRCVYGGVAEVSVYVSEKVRSKGIGQTLLQRLIRESEHNGFWTLQAGIFPENDASIHLHRKVGFRFLGKREKVGKTSLGIWKDNLVFERRSKIVGID